MEAYGGVQNQVSSINSFLNEHDQFTSKIAAPNSDDFNIGNSINIPFNGSVSPVCLIPIKHELTEALNWADVVHIHEPFVPLIFWRLPKNIKYIFTHHASLNNFVTFLLSILYKFIRRNGISTYVSRLSKKNAVALNREPHLIPNMFYLNNNVDFAIKKRFLFIGRDEKRKNLKLYRNYVESFYDSKFKYSAITNTEIKNNHIDTFLNPNDDEKNKILNDSDIYLALNTHGESFGITLIEAINSGNIVISSNLEAFKNLLGDSGVYFENNSLTSLNDVLEVIKKEELYNIWLKQKKYINKYEIGKNMEKLISLYLTI
jgi:phosphatidylinositol alpha-mannosyltransferase